MAHDIVLSRGGKILLVLFELSGRSRKSIRYEDIVVSAFKKFPEDFHLKGYPEYPESGDLVHKPLYDFKKKGLVLAGKKMFALTEKGVVAVEAMINALGDAKLNNTERLGRDIEKEIARITKTPGFTLFMKGDADNIVDTDFFDYIGAAVRTPKNDFIGRLNTVSDVMKSLVGKKNPIYAKLIEYHAYMTKKFDDVITYKKSH